MDEEEKLLWMFKQVHGELTGSCSAMVIFDEEGEPKGVSLMKDGYACWSSSKVDLVFDYLTKDL